MGYTCVQKLITLASVVDRFEGSPNA